MKECKHEFRYGYVCHHCQTNVWDLVYQLEAKLKIAIDALRDGEKFYDCDDCNGAAGDICRIALKAINTAEGE